jgi:hypothetical protein
MEENKRPAISFMVDLGAILLIAAMANMLSLALLKRSLVPVPDFCTGLLLCLGGMLAIIGFLRQ